MFLLVGVLLNLLVHSADASVVTYYAYGNVATIRSVYEKAITDFMGLAENFTGVSFEPFPIILYEPLSMTDEEVAACIDFVESYDPWWRPTADDIRGGNLCGGVCGAKPVLVYKIDEWHTAANAQENAVHEANHVFQIQNGAVRFLTNSGDGGEDWRADGPRWWGEGSSTWMGDRVMRAYPSLFETPDPQRQNFAYTLGQNCQGFKETSEAQSLRLTNAIQASDEPWQELFKSFDMTRNGYSLGTQSAYYPMVYEGGYCACEFIFSQMGLNTETESGMRTAIEMVLKLEANAKIMDGWETAFLDLFGNTFGSMQEFYEAFEAAHGADGEYTYTAPVPPNGCNENGCGEYQNQAPPSGPTPSPAPSEPTTSPAPGASNANLGRMGMCSFLAVLWLPFLLFFP